MSSHRLQVAAAGGGEWEAGNRLLVERGELRIARAGVLGRARVASRTATTLTDVLDGAAGAMLGGVDLRGEEHEALQRMLGEEGAPACMVLRFDDPDLGRGSWVLAGTGERVAGARRAVEEARTAAPSGATPFDEGIPVPERPPRTPGRHRTIIVVIATLLVGIIAVGTFAAIRVAEDADLTGGGGDPSPSPADPAPEADPPPPAEPEPDPEPEPEPVVPAPYAPGGLVRIEREVAERIGRAAPRYTSIIVSGEFAIFTVAAGGADIDSYSWRDGLVSGPEPVRVTGNPGATPAEASFTRGDVRLAALPRLARRAGRIPLGGDTEVSTTVIQRFLPFSEGVVFLMNVKGDRATAQLRADARGSVTEIVR